MITITFALIRIMILKIQITMNALMVI